MPKNLVLDGPIGVGKSFACNVLRNKIVVVGPVSVVKVSFITVPEVGHVFALSPLSKVTSGQESVDIIDQTFSSACHKCAQALTSLESVESIDRGVVESIRDFMQVSEQRQKNEMFGIFQNVMLACSLALVLDTSEVRMMDVYRGSSAIVPRCDVDEPSSRVVFVMDRDPTSNILFMENLTEASLLSPMALFFYRQMLATYRKMQSNSVEIWLWCTPWTAYSRVKFRARDTETGISERKLEEYQCASFRRIMAVYWAKQSKILGGRRTGGTLDRLAELLISDLCEITPDQKQYRLDIWPFPEKCPSGLMEYSQSRVIAVANWNAQSLRSDDHRAKYGDSALLLLAYEKMINGIFKEPCVLFYRRIDAVIETEASSRVVVDVPEMMGSHFVLQVKASSFEQVMRDSEARGHVFSFLSEAISSDDQLVVLFILEC